MWRRTQVFVWWVVSATFLNKSMMTLFLMVAVFAVSAMMAMLVIPPITHLALHRNLLDYPDGDRRMHTRAVPRLGGVAVFAGFLAALIFAVVMDRVFHRSVGATPPYFWRLTLACVILFVIGLTDDLRGVRPTLKILGQVLAALIVCPSSIAITTLHLPPNIEFSLGWMAMPVTILWLVGMSNAFNLIDGLDGLAAGVGVIALAAIAASGAVVGRPAVPVYAIALAGALIGFLRFNFAPARIFLGDSGSLVVGFLLAFLSVRGATRLDGTLFAIVPIFALAYPLLDTAIAILRRWLRGDPLSRADGRHIHHQLFGLIGARRAAKLIYVTSVAMAGLGVSVTFGPPAMTVEVVVLGLAGLLLMIFYALSWLDYHEFREAAVILTSGASRARSALRDTINARDVASLIARADSLDELDAILGKCAPTFRFTSMQLGGAHPAAATSRMMSSSWRFEYPLVLDSGDTLPRDTSEIPFLTIVCATAGDRPTSVERVVAVLAPAISAWFAQRTIAVHELKARSRTSGSARRAYPSSLPLDTRLTSGEFGDSLMTP